MGDHVFIWHVTSEGFGKVALADKLKQLLFEVASKKANFLECIGPNRLLDECPDSLKEHGRVYEIYSESNSHY